MTFFCATHILRVMSSKYTTFRSDATALSEHINKINLKNGNYGIKTPVRFSKRYIPLLIDLLISNNFSSMTFFAQRVFYELPVVKVYSQSTDFFNDFLA